MQQIYLTLAKRVIAFNSKANLYHLTSPICCLESKSHSIKKSHIESYPHCSVYLLRKHVLTLFLKPSWSVYFKMKYSYNEETWLHFPKHAIKLLSSQSSANCWHSKPDLSWWILALLVPFQGLTQGCEKDTFFLYFPQILVPAPHTETGVVFAVLGARWSWCLRHASV